jgi:hypothetical protein
MLAAAMALALGAAAPAGAAALAVGGPWSTFDFAEAGSALTDFETFETSYSFTLAESAYLRVVDGGLTGDRFELFNNGLSLGLTSVPGDAGPLSVVDDFDAALADGRWSFASFLLAPGSYTITGVATLSPFDGGIGGIQLAAVPEPGTFGLLAAGLAALVLALRCKA